METQSTKTVKTDNPAVQKAEPAAAGARKEGFLARWNSEDSRTNRRGFGVLYRKELADHLESKRFWILFFLLLIISMVSLRGALNTISTTVSQASSQGASITEFLFLALFTTSGSSIYSFSTFLGFLGPIFGIMMGFDAINEEQAQGTLNRLAAQPIYRDTIINAKFAAAATVVFLTVFAVGFLFTGAGILISGIEPLGEEFGRIAIFLLVASIYVCVWLSIAILFSVLSRHAATSALGCIALWLFLTLFLNLLSSGIANAMIPVNNNPAATVMDVIRNYRLQTGISRISPYYLFSEVTSVLMNPNVHSLDIMSTLEAQYSQIASYLSLGQSVLQIWPQIVAMFAETVVGFAIAYICFMNREIRA